jgi:hypothetical protein
MNREPCQQSPPNDKVQRTALNTPSAGTNRWLAVFSPRCFCHGTRLPAGILYEPWTSKAGGPFPRPAMKNGPTCDAIQFAHFSLFSASS